MAQMEHIHIGRGNTNNSSSTKKRSWILTINNPTDEDWQQLDELNLDEKVKDLIAQDEIGKEGTEHIQMFINWNNARTFNSMKKLFPKAHIEFVKDFIKAAEYCMKEESRNPLGKNIKKIESKTLLKLAHGTMEQTHSTIVNGTRDPLEEKEPYNWQKEIIELVEQDPDERTIHWYWDSKGCSGKTTLAKHLVINNDDILFCTGSAKDVKYMVSTWINNNKYERHPHMIIFNFVRSFEKDYISYQAIEEVKDGIFMSSKYESNMIVYNPPHVICFSNSPPNIEKLSKDRWNIKEI